MAHPTIILVLFVLLIKTVFTSYTPITTNINNTDMALTERWSFGKNWYIYVETHLYNITCIKFCKDGMNIIAKPARLPDILTWI